MKHGFVKAAAITPAVRVADTKFNTEEICRQIKNNAKKGVKIFVFPELAITGYTCGDLFLQELLLDQAIEGLLEITKVTEAIAGIVFVGLPVCKNGKLYNVAAAVSGGRILGLVPKRHIPNYNEFYEARYFVSGEDITSEICINGCQIGRAHV